MRYRDRLTGLYLFLIGDELNSSTSKFLIPNAWVDLKCFTPARIALGRVGNSVPTAPHLDFQLAHAKAREAIFHPLPLTQIQESFKRVSQELLLVESCATDREIYLKRPDLGRKLSEESVERLKNSCESLEKPYDVVFVVADGLSPLAIEKNAHIFLEMIFPEVRMLNWHIAPIVLALNARVAIGDEVAVALNARMVVVLIGERPGLSSPDSMGIYMTWAPRHGSMDSERNCLSNIRPAGMSYLTAKKKLMYLMTQACHRSLSGVGLKEDANELINSGSSNSYFVEHRS